MTPEPIFAGKPLAGKAALVTGSTSGIGLGIARALADAGTSVVLNGFGTREAIDAARADIEGRGATTYHDPTDLRVAADVEAMVRRAEESFGAVDVLVNNAGIQHVSPVHDFPAEQWDDVIAVNLSSAFHTIRCRAAGDEGARTGAAS